MAINTYPGPGQDYRPGYRGNTQSMVPWPTLVVQQEMENPGSTSQQDLEQALGVTDFSQLPPPGGVYGSLFSQGGGRSGQSSVDRQAAAERKALNDWYRSGGHLRQYEGLRSALSGQTAAARQAAQSQYDLALRNILGGYSGAEQMIGTGYNAVADYLRQNMPNAYAGFQAAPVAPEQASSGYFGAYGVDMAPVMAQIVADQQSAQYGAGAFTNLVDILNRSSQQAAASRQAELELARNLGMQGLGQQRAAMESNAMAALQQALGQISASEQDKLYEIAAAEAAARAEGDQALAPERRASTRTETINNAVANNRTLRAVVAQTNPGFLAKNPNATKKQLEAAFPAVAKAFNAAKSGNRGGN